MNAFGISAFVAMEQSANQNIEYLKLARSFGYQKLFTSLHIPEADYQVFAPECRKLLDAAGELGYEVTADISPSFWTKLGVLPRDLCSIGLTTLRIDYGFDYLKIRELAEVSRCRIELNASVITETELNFVLSSGLDRRFLSAGHNYYPRPETGLGFEIFMRRSEGFKTRGIPVSAFIPCLQNPRGPFFAGLPTLESHRSMTTAEAVRQLWTSCGVDSIFFGDPAVPALVLESAVSQFSDNSGPVMLRIRTELLQSACKSILWAPLHTNRLDAAASVVRSQESRGLCLSPILPQQIVRARRRGDVTIDNVSYGRYMGELQVVLRDLPADDRVNVVGRVLDEDLCLLECLTPGRSFCLKEANL